MLKDLWSPIFLVLYASKLRLVLTSGDTGQQYQISATMMEGLPERPNDVEEIYEFTEDEIQSPGDSGCCKLLSTSPYQLNEGFGSDPLCGYVPSTGELMAYMIFVDFEDAPASESTTDLHRLFMPRASEWYGNASFSAVGSPCWG